MVRPSAISSAYSVAWPATKNAPIRNVRTNHSRRPHLRTSSADPFRPTWPRSAAKTPAWQVNECSTSTVVLTAANGTLSSPCPVPTGSCPLARRLGGDGANREVRREQGGEEHQLAREPDDGADADHAGTVACPCSRDAGSRLRWPPGHYVGAPPRSGSDHPELSAGPVAVFPSVPSPGDAIEPLTRGQAADGRDGRAGSAGGDRAGGRGSTCTACTGWARRDTLVEVARTRLLRRRPGQRGDRHPSALGALRHVAAPRAHGAAHDPVDGHAAGPVRSGAPVTLRPAHAGQDAPRRWLLAVLHSRVGQGALTFPLVGLTLFVLSPLALYFCGWYEATCPRQCCTT